MVYHASHIPEFGRRYFRKFITPANFDRIKLLNRQILRKDETFACEVFKLFD